MPAPATTRRKPGPKTPEGADAWAEHPGGLRASYRPRDDAEEKLLAALAAAMWLEIRADRALVETLARIVPDAPGRGHGTDLQEPEHGRALTTALRYQAAAGMATSRAQRAFLAHRKAVRDGLRDEPEAGPTAPERTNEPRPSRPTGTGRLPRNWGAPSPSASPSALAPLGLPARRGTSSTIRRSTRRSLPPCKRRP